MISGSGNGNRAQCIAQAPFSRSRKRTVGPWLTPVQRRDGCCRPSDIPTAKAITTACNGLRSILASIAPLAAQIRFRAPPAVLASFSLASPTASETRWPAACV